jgi:intein/homing endonuclease
MAQSQLDTDLAKLRSNGLVLPRHPGRAQQSYAESVMTTAASSQNPALRNRIQGDVNAMRGGLKLGRTMTDNDYSRNAVAANNQALISHMGAKRGQSSGGMRRESREQRQSRLYPTMPKTATLGGGGSPIGGDVQMGVPRFYDPLEYWDLSGLPWNVADEGHRHKLHKWLRLYYATHYLVPILVDIFTRFPLVGMELECKDSELIKIYDDIFLDQLDYENFLVQLGREYWCALPGEFIQGSEGPVDIAQVRAGDRVLTHTGDIHMVKGASSRHYEGGFVTIRPYYGLPMRYTDGHPFLVRRERKIDWVPVEQIVKSDELFVPLDKTTHVVERINVWDTLSDDWLTVPDHNEIDTMSIPDHVTWTDSVKKYRSYIRRSVKGLTPGDVWKRNAKCAQHSPLQKWIDVDEELLWFLGLYLAEGYVTKDGVQIALHAKETEYADRVVTFAACLGLNATIRRGSSDNGIVVVIYSISFGAWINSMMGTGVDTKHVPEWIMQSPQYDQAYFLRGYFDGDGHYGNIRIFAACKSKCLAMQVERLVRRMGVVSTINEAHSVTERGTECTWYMVGPCLADTNAFAQRIGKTPVWKERQCAFADWDESGYWVKVASITHNQYSGPVYNIEVEGDHSYVGSVATHNCVGEAFPLGSFDEDLGIWEHEELINPEDVVIDNFPMLDAQQIKIVPPDYLRRIVQTKSPAREWYQIQEQMEDLIPYLLKGEHIPISPVMIRQIANKANPWDDHGTPILMRALRTLIHEEKLLASQDAIAERLYSPFILAKLGIMDMGDGLPPYIPTYEEVEAVRDDIDIAMASDFRVMVHHFGLDMESVFGREQMPRLGDDFDRVERRLMQVFGVNPSLLSAGSNAQPYASSALQAEFMNQTLRTYQGILKSHFKERAMVVAEAQGHYEYERKGKTRVPVYETVVEWDDEGNKQLVRKRKLLVPTLEFQTFDLRDEATERQFLTELRGQGIPIPDDKLMVGITWKHNDFITEYNEERIHNTIAQQQAKMDTYVALIIKGLPVPADLKMEVESVLAAGQPGGGQSAMGMPPGGAPPGGGAPGGGAPPGAGGGMMMPPPPADLGAGPGSAPPGGGPPPTGPTEGGPAGNVPNISNERRPGLTYNTKTAAGELTSEPDDWSMTDRITGELATDYELGNIAEEQGWSGTMKKRAKDIRDEIRDYGSFTHTNPSLVTSSSDGDGSIGDDEQTDDPTTWKLAANQELIEEDGNQAILARSKKKKLNIPVEASKKYSIVDPLAEALDESDEGDE